MRKLTAFLCLLSVGLIGTTGCHFSYTDGYMFDYSGVSVERTTAGEFPEGILEVVIENKFGSVAVQHQPDVDGSWEWTGKVWGDDQELAELFSDELEMSESVSGGKLSLIVVLPESDSALNGVKSNLIVNVPEGVAVSTVNSHGDTQLVGIKSAVNSQNRHGNTHLAKPGCNLQSNQYARQRECKERLSADCRQLPRQCHACQRTGSSHHF